MVHFQLRLTNGCSSSVGAEGLAFNSRVGQIADNVASSSPLLQPSWDCVAQALPGDSSHHLLHAFA